MFDKINGAANYMFSEIRFKGYKSFPSDRIMCIENIKHVNVFIGKNNAGKSSVLDIVEACLDINSPNLKDIKNLSIKLHLSKDLIDPLFFNKSKSPIVAQLDYNRMLPLIGETCYVDVGKKVTQNTKNIWEYSLSKHQSAPYFSYLQNDPLTEDYWPDIMAEFVNVNNVNVFRKLFADRDIKPEYEHSNGDICLNFYGEGASILFKRYLHDGEHDDALIEDVLLKALNEIMGSESKYDRIKVKRINGNKSNELGLFEVFLQETGSASFALSKSGSGLKTIILVLLNLLVIPKTNQYLNKKLHYGFEELENNLHPAMQRRLFDYIYEYATKKGVYVFLTTHSHVAINSFFGKKDAQLYHVTKENNKSYIQKIENHLGTAEILDDLGVKASDLLQSNGIIWVEGPSDRIYIKRWLEIFGGGEFEEGKHYQILCYGGKLLFHYSADFTPEEETRYINMLIINRNAAVVIDSDKKQKTSPINPTKERIQQEFNKNNMPCWITSGKEIENYVPVDAINTSFQKNIKQCAPYEAFSEYTKFNSIPFDDKVEFANKVIKHINKDNASILDVEDRINGLVNAIKKWNNMP